MYLVVNSLDASQAFFERLVGTSLLIPDSRPKAASVEVHTSEYLISGVALLSGLRAVFHGIGDLSTLRQGRDQRGSLARNGLGDEHEQRVGGVGVGLSIPLSFLFLHCTTPS